MGNRDGWRAYQYGTRRRRRPAARRLPPRISMRRISPAALLLAFAVACAGDSPSGPGELRIEPSTTELSSGVSALVLSVPSVTVRDARGQGVPDVSVRWTVVSGGGHVETPTVRTNAQGVASSGGWTLGPEAGVQTLQATAQGMRTVVFTATAVAAPPVALVRVTPELPMMTVGTTVTAPPEVRAVDASGYPVANVPVVFSVIAGGGTLSSEQATTDSRGVATAGVWTLGTAAGTQAVRATSNGLTAADIEVHSVGGAPVSMTLVSGQDQQGFAGSAIPQPPTVRVLDHYGNNVGNAAVTFTAGPGSGTVSGATVQTDFATGTASVSSWILGAAPLQTLVATSASLPGTSVTFRANVTASQFDIDVRFVGEGGTERQRQAFASAVSRWRRVITGDIGTTSLNVPAGECASWIPAIHESINDLVIYVRLTAIDGVGKILGQASPCYVNSTSKLPVLGFFELDVDDLAKLLDRGTLDDVVLHEMGHILGVGTMWSYGRTLLTGRGGDDPYFTGAAGRESFMAFGGITYTSPGVPVENSGAAGTRDAHWRRTIFANELMQGYAQAGGMPMSRVTIASLADLGYTVSYNGADSFSFFPALRALAFDTPVSLGDDIVDNAIWEVEPTGVRRKMRVGTERR